MYINMMYKRFMKLRTYPSSNKISNDYFYSASFSNTICFHVYRVVSIACNLFIFVAKYRWDEINIAI